MPLDGPPKKRQTLPPSHLRHELQAESDGGGSCEGESVQCPGSDVVIPETQLDDPNAAVNLSGVEQSTQLSEIPWHLFASQTWERDPVPDITAGFAWAPAPPKDGVEISKAATSFGSVRTDVKAVKAGSTTNKTSNFPSSAVSLPVLDNVQAQSANCLETADAHTAPPLVTNSRFEKSDAGHDEIDLHKTASNGLSSKKSIDRPTNVEKKQHSKINKKKIQKASGGRRPRLVPPQSGQATSGLLRAPCLEQPTSSATTTFFTPVSSARESDIFYLGSCPANPPQDMRSRHTEPVLRSDPNEERSGFGSQGLTVGSSKVDATTAVEQLPRQAPYVGDGSVRSVSKERSPDHIDPVRVNVSVNSSYNMNSDQVSSMPLKPLPSSYTDSSCVVVPKEACDVTPVTIPRGKISNSVPHGVPDRSRTLRVTKQRKPPRGAQNTQSIVPTSTSQARTAPVISNVDRAMEMLRVALLSDQIRAEHDHKLKDSQAKEVNEALRALVETQEAAIVDLKAQQLESAAKISRITEKAKTNQKYVAGIQTDYEKLQNSFATLQAESKKELQDKIAELEAEKQVLRREFEVTTDTLRQSQRKTRSAADEIYISHSTSHLERKALALRLELQTARYEDKKKRCEELERQVLSSVQNVQHQLNEISTTVIEKLSHLQSRSDHINDESSRGAMSISQCLVELKELQATPFLTTKDLENVEGLLQRIFERVDLTPKDRSETADSVRLTIEGIESNVRDQLQNLRCELQKHEEMALEIGLARQSITSLEDRLKTEKQRFQQLDESISALRQTEADLRLQLSHTERELEASKAMACQHESDPLELENKVTALQQQLEQTSQRLEAANEKARQSEGLREQQEKELDIHKEDIEACRAKLLEMAKQNDEQTTKENMAKLRTRVEAEYNSIFEKKKHTLLDEIHALKLNCTDKDKLIQELSKEVDAQKNTRQTERQNLKKKEAELETLRKDKMENDAQLRTAQQKSTDNGARVSEITDLKAQLRSKTDELHAKERDYDILERERTKDTEKLSELQNMRQEWQAKISESDREMETLRAEAHHATTAETKRLQDALEESQSLALALENDNRRLQSECDQASATEKRMNEAEAAFSVERDELQRQMRELQLAKDDSDAAAVRIRDEVADEIQRAVDGSRSQMDDLRHQLKQAEAKNRELEATNQRQIQYHREATEAKYQLLLKGAERVTRGQQQAAQPMITPGTPSQTSRSLQSLGMENNELPTTGRAAGGLRSESPQSDQQDQNIFSLFDEELNNVYGSQWILDPDAEVVIETQELDLPRPLSAQSSDEHTSRLENPVQHRRSSTVLSSADSELMTQLEQTGHLDSPTTLRGREEGHSRQPFSREHLAETSNRSQDMFSSGSHSSPSQERPRSQANTASRMVPPQGTLSHHYSPRNHALDKASGVKARHPKQKNSGDTVQGNHDSSVVSETNRTTVRKQTSSRHIPGLTRRLEQDDDNLLESQSSPRRKRRTQHDHDELEMPSKKSRVLPKNLPLTRNSYSPSPSGPSTGLLDSTKQHGRPLPKNDSIATHTRTQLPLSGIESYKKLQQQASDGADSRRNHLSPSARSLTSATPRRTSTRITNKPGKTRHSEYEQRFAQEFGRR